VSRRIAVLVFPGTNSEDETLRVLRDCDGDAELVHWSRARTLPAYDAYVLPGGFAYEDRIRAGAIAAHDAMMDTIVDGAGKGKMVLGICNGAQILLEAGLAPGTGEARRATAAFTHNLPGRHFICRYVRVRLAVEPTRCAITASLPHDVAIPAWAAHGEGRLAAHEDELEAIASGQHVVFVYADGAPNGSALDCAALTNRQGNVLAIMPHPERVYPEIMRRPLYRSFVEAVKRS
jgi:phosphoribosylformylglycinamidine synthase subunit PurQ / glutaminase